MIVLLLLGVIWAAVLVPPWLQNRREARPIASIRSFHRQLWLLERTSPGRGSVPYGSRLHGGVGYGAPAYTGYGDDYGDETYAGYDDADEPDHRGYDGEGHNGYDAGRPAGLDHMTDARWADVADARRRTGVERSPADLHRRAQGYRRRRRVLSVVLLAAVATAPPAALLGGTGWWVTQAVADALLLGYVALLVQRQHRALERDEKVHYLAPIRAPRPAVVVLHGGAAH